MTTQTLPEIKLNPQISTEDQNLINSANSFIAAMEARTVQSASDYEVIANDLMLIKGRSKRLEEARVSVTKPINEGLAAINKMFKEPIAIYEKCERIIKDKMRAFNAEQERIRAEHEANLRAEQEAAAAKERERLERQADKQLEKGNVEKAEELLEKAETVTVQPVSIPKQTVAVSGIKQTKTWKARIVDFSKIPPNFLVITDKQKDAHQAYLNSFAKTNKGALPIAGVEFYEEVDIASGAR